MLKKIMCGFIAVMILTFSCFCVFAEDVDSLESKQAELESQNAEYEAILAEKNEEVEEQQEYVDAIVGRVTTVNEEIALSREKIELLDESIEEKTEEIEEANEELEEQMDTLRNRIKTIYMAGDVSSLEIILGAKDFTDFIDKVQLVKSVSEFDKELMDEIEEKLETISEEKESLEEDKAALEEEQELLEENQAELETLLEENQSILANLQQDSADVANLIEANLSELAGLDTAISEYYEELKLQQQQQQQQQQGSSSSGSTDNYKPTNPDPIVSVPSGGGWVWPTPGFYYRSSTFYEDRGGIGHGALDIAGSGIMGSPVVAVTSGTVISTCTYCSHNWGKYYSCGCGGGYGNYVMIDHGGGKSVIYAHFSSVSVSPGDSVSAGQVIGYVGTTGYSTGPHLHFECLYYGVKYDPETEY